MTTYEYRIKKTYECRTTTSTYERKKNNLFALALVLALALTFLALSLSIFSASNFRVIGDLLKNF